MPTGKKTPGEPGHSVLRKVCRCASACPVCPVSVPAPPGVFFPVLRNRSLVSLHSKRSRRSEN